MNSNNSSSRTSAKNSSSKSYKAASSARSLSEDADIEEGKSLLEPANDEVSFFLQFKSRASREQYSIFRRDSFSVRYFAFIHTILTLALLARSIPVIYLFCEFYRVSFRVYFFGCVCYLVFGVGSGWLLLLAHYADRKPESKFHVRIWKLLGHRIALFEAMYIFCVVFGCGVQLIAVTIAPICDFNNLHGRIFPVCATESGSFFLPQIETLLLFVLPIILQQYTKCPNIFVIGATVATSMFFFVAALLIGQHRWRAAYVLLLMIGISAIAYETERREIEVFIQSKRVHKSQMLATVSLRENIRSNLQAKTLRQVVANVSHDLLSPIQALDMGFESLSNILEDNANILEKLLASARETIRSADMKQVGSNLVELDNKPCSSSGKTPRYGLAKALFKDRPDESTSSTIATTEEIIEFPTLNLGAIHNVKADIEVALVSSGAQIRSGFELLQSMRGSLTLMSMIINRSLDVSKVHGNLPLVPNYEFFDYKDSIGKSVNCVRNMQADTQLVIQPFPDMLDALVYSDRRWFEGNILCILSNAIKFSSPTYPVVLEASMERTMNGSAQLRIEVTDSGRSLSSAERDLFFLPPEQTRRESMGGSGMGLFALAKRVEALNGRVGACARTSPPGAPGTTVWFSIPVGRTDARTAALSSRQGMAPPVSEAYSIHSLRASPVIDNSEEASVSKRLSHSSTPRSDNYFDIELALRSHIEQATSNLNVLETDAPTIVSDDYQDPSLIAPLPTSTKLKPPSSLSQRGVASSAIIPTIEERMSGADRHMLYGSSRRNSSADGEVLSGRSTTPRARSPRIRSANLNSSVPSPAAPLSTPQTFARLFSDGSVSLCTPRSQLNVVDILSSTSPVLVSSSGGVHLPPLSHVNLQSLAYTPDSNASSNINTKTVDSSSEPSRTNSSISGPDSSVQRQFSGASVDLNATPSNHLSLVDSSTPMAGVLAEAQRVLTAGTLVTNSDKSATQVPFALAFSALGKSRSHLSDDDERSFRKLFADGSFSNSNTARSQRIVLSRSLSVLVVDDSMSIMKIMRMSLERAGHTVHSAANGQIALDMMKESQYDVVIMDLQMPVMGGIEACKEFRKFEDVALYKARTRTKRQLIIGMSANGEALTRQAALDADMDDFIAKPFSLNSMMAALKYLDPDIG